jgi:hypothetical protein
VFDQMAGRYQTSGGPNLGVYPKGHVGDSIRVDRKGWPAEHVGWPALTIGISPQPDVLHALADRPGFRGRGLLARFLYALPVNLVGQRQVNAPPVPAHVRDTYSAELQALCSSLAAALTGRSSSGSTRPPPTSWSRSRKRSSRGYIPRQATSGTSPGEAGSWQIFWQTTPEAASGKVFVLVGAIGIEPVTSAV